ncbi:hypothetical protein ABZ845_30810 [Streptomyces sp. NPDC047022]|uniref:hypothetical protein n=1 Tax=Streptomyces sp. NPDC047022 TaxID=3155737 RepID=UPI0033C512B1
MPYIYECRRCEVHSDEPHKLEEDALNEQRTHRRLAHGALKPGDDDRVRRIYLSEHYVPWWEDPDAPVPSDGFPLGRIVLFLVVCAVLRYLHQHL